jgi:hypothetical protein
MQGDSKFLKTSRIQLQLSEHHVVAGMQMRTIETTIPELQHVPDFSWT